MIRPLPVLNDITVISAAVAHHILYPYVCIT